MAHCDLGDHVPCHCSACTETRRFAEFRDLLPDQTARPAAITDRREAAAFLRWYSAQLIVMVDQATDVLASDVEESA
jgi:hypothetical protein